MCMQEGLRNEKTYDLNKLEEVYEGLRSKYVMWEPIKKFIQGAKTLGVQNRFPMFCAVQVERVQGEHAKTFGIKDSQILRNLWILLSSIISRLWNAYEQSQKVDRTMNILQTFREITMERNHVKIFNKINEYVPKLLEVEKVGIFFVDTANTNIIYSITSWEAGSDGIPYITQVAKYPWNIGLTGKAITSK